MLLKQKISTAHMPLHCTLDTISPTSTAYSVTQSWGIDQCSKLFRKTLEYDIMNHTPTLPLIVYIVTVVY